MSKSWQISRRHFLRGIGTSIALPMLDAMAPQAFAAAASGSSAAPIRMGFFFVPNGVNMADWRPTRTGAHYDLPFSLQPLAELQNDILVVSGLTQDKGRANGDGAGDHARSGSVFLTGSQPLKSEGSEIRSGQSVDQYAAEYLREQTTFASLELGTESGRPLGKCDSGYSCGYSNNISWRDSATPMQKLVDPREVFERLFSDQLQSQSQKERARKERKRKSILDVVMQDVNSLNGNLGGHDQQKLDEYLTSIREIEQRIQRAESGNSETRELVNAYEIPEPGTPESVDQHLQLLGDMLVLAFQTDTTRVSTFMFANAGSNRSYGMVGVNDGHHELSHHQGDAEKLTKISVIDRFHIEQFAYILKKMKSIKEGDVTLLDNTMIVYGSGIGDGNRHNHDDLPVLVAGRGGGTITSGRHIQMPPDTPMCNLFNSMLDRAGVPVDCFGDSTGRMRELAI
ncbi:MAG: DUF1552 domain-containing protein [Verrucomicrobia bacterium]|nr:DUF1552 domain-containing protein [Verrucomicrobiota bacterium]